MREIKFRAWDKEYKGMLPVDGINFNSFGFQNFKDSSIASYCDESGKINVIRMSEIELMEFTGRRDIGYSEVYEGDILGDTEGHTIGPVYWDSETGGWAVGDDNFNGPLSDYANDGIEVIGNVYENMIEY
ncbi:MAG: hypothetical protein H6Q72_4751 [Firmicutes bacterium]|nr:hypothetical protein [Bacillota bacterium]